MEIKFSNLGPVKDATLGLSPLTIICGRNNTGKSYLSYSLFGVLSYLKFLSFKVDKDVVHNLINEGVARISIGRCLEHLPEHLREISSSVTQMLPIFFAANPAHFRRASVEVSLNDGDIETSKPKARNVPFGRLGMLTLNKSLGKDYVEMSISGFSHEALDNAGVIERLRKSIGEFIRDYLFAPLIGQVYFASTERTGALIFRDELSEHGQRVGSGDILDLDHGKFPSDFLGEMWKAIYPLPVTDDIQFIKHLKTIVNRESPLSRRNPELIAALDAISGGQYNVTEKGVTYSPVDNPSLRLQMDESSSSVRSLVKMSFWIRHLANRGDFLMIDEPEMNLHPSSQRLMARWIAMLVNKGVRVLITTHSDYLVKELNTLIMLRRGRRHERILRLMEENGITNSMLLSPSLLSLYVADRGKRSAAGNTGLAPTKLEKVEVDASFGAAVPSFDDTIHEINALQRAIILGD